MIESKTKPWLVLIVCCGLAAASMGLLCNSVGVFYTTVSNDLGVLRGSFTLHITISSIVSAFMAFVVARLLFKVNYKALLIFGVTCCVVSTVLMGFSTELWQFYLLGALRGIGINFFSLMPITMIVSYWFEKLNGLATSIVLSFSGLAGAIASPLLTRAIESVGWQKAYIIMGIALLVLCLPAILYPFEMNPRYEGKLPYGYTPKEEAETESVSNRQSSFKAFTPAFIAFLVVTIFVTAITGLPQHFTGYAENIGLTASVGSLMISACMIGNISSKLIIGVLSDKIGIFFSSIIMLFINLVSLIVLLFSSAGNIAIVSSFFFGAIYAISAVGLSLLTKEFFGSENYSQAYSMVSFCMGIAGAFAASLIGYAYDFTGAYTAVIIFFILSHVVIFFSLLIIRRNQKRKKAMS